MTLIYLGCAWLAGILLASFLHLPSGLVGLLMLLPLAGLFLWRKDQRVRLISLCFLSLLLGVLYFTIRATPQDFDASHLAHYNDQGWVRIEGIVSGEPDVRDTYTNLRVAVSRIEVDGQERDVKGTVLVRAPAIRSTITATSSKSRGCWRPRQSWRTSPIESIWPASASTRSYGVPRSLSKIMVKGAF